MSVEILDLQKHLNLKWRCLGATCANSCCYNFQYIYVPMYEVLHVSKYFPVVIMLRQTNKGLVGNFVAISKLDENTGCIFLEDTGCLLGNEKPSFCKAYPFSIVPSKDDSNKNLVLIDINCPGFSEKDGEPIFEEKGKINPKFDNEFLKFALFIKEDAKKTNEFIRELVDSKLLSVGKFVYSVKQKQPKQKEISFNYIDERKLLNLSKDKIENFVSKGYMKVIYAHLNSLYNFQKLLSQLYG